MASSTRGLLYRNTLTKIAWIVILPAFLMKRSIDAQERNGIKTFSRCWNTKVRRPCALHCKPKDFAKVIRFYKDGIAQEGCYQVDDDQIACTSYIPRYEMKHNNASNEITLNITSLELEDSGLWTCKYGKEESKNLTLNVYEFESVSRDKALLTDNRTGRVFSRDYAFLLKCCYPEPLLSVRPECPIQFDLHRQLSNDCTERKAQSYIVESHLKNCTERILNITLYLASTEVITFPYENIKKSVVVQTNSNTTHNKKVRHGITISVAIASVVFATCLIFLIRYRRLKTRRQHQRKKPIEAIDGRDEHQNEMQLL